MGHSWIAASVLALAALAANPTLCANEPEAEVGWAYPPLAPPASPPAPPPDVSRTRRLPGSKLAFSDAALHDQFRAVDWRPGERPPSPLIVRQGRQPEARACGFCHLPEGSGRPENAALAGLPADYIVRQLTDMRVGARRSVAAAWGPAEKMRAVAQAVTPAEATAAAQYFAARRFVAQTRVIEAASIPKATPVGAAYRFATGGPREPLGLRIAEGPDDFERFELRDDRVRYTAYVPPGSIARGARDAAATDHGRTQACASCHGRGLTGDAGPPLAGRSPTGLFRQLYAFKTGARNAAASAPMREVAARLSVRDMIDLAAYAGSLRP